VEIPGLTPEILALGGVAVEPGAAGAVEMPGFTGTEAPGDGAAFKFTVACGTGFETGGRLIFAVCNLGSIGVGVWEIEAAGTAGAAVETGFATPGAAGAIDTGLAIPGAVGARGGWRLRDGSHHRRLGYGSGRNSRWRFGKRRGCLKARRSWRDDGAFLKAKRRRWCRSRGRTWGILRRETDANGFFFGLGHKGDRVG